MRADRATTVVGLAALALLVGGCATDDPRAGGFLGGVVGLASGRYASDLQQKQGQLAGLRAEGERLGAEGRRLEAERAALAAAIEARRREAAALAGRTAELEATIAGLRRDLARTEARRAELAAGAVRRDEGPATGPGAAMGDRRQELERLAEEAAALRAELDELESAAETAAARRAELGAEIERLEEDLAARPWPGSRAADTAAAPGS